MLAKLTTIFFLLIVFLIPINLGKHAVTLDSYVKFHLIDYLVPTLWMIDILIFFYVSFWVLTTNLAKIPKFAYVRLLLIYIFSLLPSLALAPRTDPALFGFLTTLLHVVFAISVATSIRFEKITNLFIKVCAYSVALVSLLAIVQWFQQSSVFDNYLFFGEQPYDITTPDVHLVNYFGERKIPPYSVFRHPNILGGYLAIMLPWLFYGLFYLKLNFQYSREIFFLGIVSLLLTFSVTAQITFFLGILFLLIITKYGKRGVKVVMVLTAIPVLVGVFFPLLSRVGWFQDYPSVYRRSNLAKSAYMIIEKNFLFGGGLNNFTVIQEDFLPSTQVLRFIQPVHNIFILVFSESGIFTLITLVALLLFCIKVLLGHNFGFPAVFFVTILQFFILGSFDHYLFTIHQMQILFWLTVGLSLTYTNIDVEVQN